MTIQKIEQFKTRLEKITSSLNNCIKNAEQGFEISDLLKITQNEYNSLIEEFKTFDSSLCSE